MSVEEGKAVGRAWEIFSSGPPGEPVTRIVATVGPACESKETLKTMVQAGMDLVRLNFSHGTYDEFRAIIGAVKELEQELGREIYILQDLQGRKVRTGRFQGGSATLRDGEIVSMTTREVEGTATLLPVVFPELLSQIQPGMLLSLNDGKILLEIMTVTPPDAHCRVHQGGELRNHAGVTIPGLTLNLPPLSLKDREDLQFGLQEGVDLVALSFVQSPDDLRTLKDLIQSGGKDLPVVAKIETVSALQQIQGIIEEADVIMVARGDLGDAVPMEVIPVVQKGIIAMAKENGKPVITATEMLASMTESLSPTRAETTDVANAVWDGTSAVMLSQETNIGKHPVQAVRMMDRIIQETEEAIDHGVRVSTPGSPVTEYLQELSSRLGSQKGGSPPSASPPAESPAGGEKSGEKSVEPGSSSG